MPRISPLVFIEQAQEAPPPACILCGDETQLIEEARAAVCRHFAPENRRIIDLEKLPEDESALLGGKGLFGGGAELYQLFSNGKPSTAAMEFVETLLQRTSPPDAVMLVLTNWDYKYKKAVWFKTLSALMPPLICDRLLAKHAKSWLRRWAAEANLNLPETAVEFLSMQTEGNLFAAKQAIAKMALTSSSAGDNSGESEGAGEGDDAEEGEGGDDKKTKPPSRQALRAALADGAKYDVTDLSDAIYAGSPIRAFSVLRQLRANRTEETLIQWTVLNILHNIATQKSGGRPMAWGWQLNALQKLAERTSEARLARLMRQSAHADRALKGVAAGKSTDILCGIAMRLAAQQSGVKITLPYSRF